MENPENYGTCPVKKEFSYIEILGAPLMNLPIFWNVVSCRLVHRYQCFREIVPPFIE
jgi:hypothetical protein